MLNSIRRAHRRPARHLSVVAVAAGLVMAGCSTESTSASGEKSAGAAASSGAPSAASHVSIAPDIAAAGRLGLAQPIKIEGATSSSQVRVTNAAGVVVDGSFDADAGAWSAKTMLKKNATYTVTVSGGGSGKPVSRTLTTAADGKGTTGIYVVRPYSFTDAGNAQPVVLTFSQPVPASEREAVKKRFTVKDTAGMTGAWRWLSPTRLDYRPREKWPMGDRVTVTGSIQGMPIGSTWGAGTLDNVGFRVTSDLEAVYDGTTREVTVTKGGKVVRTMKADGGKKGFETMSGAMVVLGKSESVRMTSCSVGISCTPGASNYYDEQIGHAVQISESGTYLHAAPWDRQLGKVDSSHGCIHLSDEDARWFYDQVIAGNLVTVKGTKNRVEVTNGEGDWNLTWQQWTAPTS